MEEARGLIRDGGQEGEPALRGDGHGAGGPPDANRQLPRVLVGRGAPLGEGADEDVAEGRDGEVDRHPSSPVRQPQPRLPVHLHLQEGVGGRLAGGGVAELGPDGGGTRGDRAGRRGEEGHAGDGVLGEAAGLHRRVRSPFLPGEVQDEGHGQEAAPGIVHCHDEAALERHHLRPRGGSLPPLHRLQAGQSRERVDPGDGPERLASGPRRPLGPRPDPEALPHRPRRRRIPEADAQGREAGEGLDETMRHAPSDRLQPSTTAQSERRSWTGSPSSRGRRDSTTTFRAR